MAGSKTLVVCSIDLGTTYSGYAFSFKADYEHDPQNVLMNSWRGGKTLSEKAPTSVLLDPKQTFHSFGYEAENKYTELAENDEHHDWYYFNRFKMILHVKKAGIPGEQLTLALEPESASIFCQKIPSSKFVDQATSGSTFIEPGKRYVVLDLGGGTADITVHKIGFLGDIHELRSASGGAWGGTRVDEEFRQFIVSFVGQDVWTEFMHKQMYDYLDMFREFETRKKTISTETSKRVIVRMPISLTDILKKKSNTTMQKALEKAGYKDKVESKGDKLFVNADLFKSFFSSAVDSIVSHLKDIFQDPASEDPPLVLMVGGFSNSKFVQERLKAAFPSKKFVVPLDAGLAVLKGSKTYSISFHKPYIPGFHLQSKITVIDSDQYFHPQRGWPSEIDGKVVMEFGKTEFRVTVYDETNKREFESYFDLLK
ncbi:hypothetical protein ACJMK2_030933 [Sinanodonta woodiana]|uniref:Uncharacterized protein n=1 Tax=Sinanodonta woodiana TaxID=1069815 RepID=A0ABD3WX96_SINWO